MVAPRLLIVARGFDTDVVARLRQLGLPTMVLDDVRALPTALSFRTPDVIVLDLPSFAPSCESAFEVVRSASPAPLVLLDDEEDRLFGSMYDRVEDGRLKDEGGAWARELPNLVRRVHARAGANTPAPRPTGTCRALLEALPSAHLALDERGVVLGSNASARTMLALDAADPAARSASIFSRIGISPDVARRLALSGSVSVTIDHGPAGGRVEVKAVRVPTDTWPEGVRYLCALREHDTTELSLHLAMAQERARRLVEHAGDMMLLHDTEGRIVDVNRQACSTLGYTREELLNLRIWDIDPHARPGAGLWAKLTEGAAVSVEAASTRKDGEVIPTEVRLSAWVEGERTLVVAFARNITERRHAEGEQRLARALFDAVSEAIMVTDTENRIVAVNPAFSAVTGYGAGEVIGQKPDLLMSGRQAPEFFDAMRRQLREDSRWEGETWKRKKNGLEYPAWMSIAAIKGRDGEVERHVAIFKDISERKRAEELVRHQAYHDTLTGLPNRALFTQRLRDEMARADRDHRKVALLFVDLDRFKSVNDTMGHHIGDKLLTLVAQRLSACARATDTLARLGGDEFTLILPGIETNDAIRDLPARILRQLETPFLIDGSEVRISCSIGAAFYPDDAPDLENLLRRADRAMYRAKEARNAWRRWEPSP